MCAFGSSRISDFPPTSFGTPVQFRGTKEILGSGPRILDERCTLFFRPSTEIEQRREANISKLSAFPQHQQSPTEEEALSVVQQRWASLRYRATFFFITQLQTIYLLMMLSRRKSKTGSGYNLRPIPLCSPKSCSLLNLDLT